MISGLFQDLPPASSPGNAARDDQEDLSAASMDPAGHWVGIVANRGSGMGGSHSLVSRLARELQGHGLGTEIAWTPEDRRALVGQATTESGCRCLVAAGGDGTVAALINERPRVPITVLPAGTENLGARHFGLKRNPAWLARTISGGRVVGTDLGHAAGRRFLLMCGFGFDGDIVSRHHRGRVSRCGKVKPTHRAAYVEPILRSSLFYRFPPISVTIEGPDPPEVLSGTTVFLFNLPRYALGLPFAPQARQDDGLLDVVIFRNPGPFQALYYLLRVFLGNHLDDPGVTHRRVRRVSVSATSPVPVQIDGDPGGLLSPGRPGERADVSQASGEPSHGEWTIEVLPHAIDVIVHPSWAASRLPVPLARQRVSG
jgi:diacylglycerol kinase family enzyme